MRLDAARAVAQEAQHEALDARAASREQRQQRVEEGGRGDVQLARGRVADGEEQLERRKGHCLYLHGFEGPRRGRGAARVPVLVAAVVAGRRKRRSRLAHRRPRVQDRPVGRGGRQRHVGPSSGAALVPRRRSQLQLRAQRRKHGGLQTLRVLAAGVLLAGRVSNAEGRRLLAPRLASQGGRDGARRGRGCRRRVLGSPARRVVPERGDAVRRRVTLSAARATDREGREQGEEVPGRATQRSDRAQGGRHALQRKGGLLLLLAGLGRRYGAHRSAALGHAELAQRHLLEDDRVVGHATQAEAWDLDSCINFGSRRRRRRP